MIFGELIGKMSMRLRGALLDHNGGLFSVRGMTVGELLKLHRDAPEIIEIMQPVLVELDHNLMEKFFNDPKMSPGKIREHFTSQFDVMLEAVQGELRKRDKLK